MTKDAMSGYLIVLGAALMTVLDTTIAGDDGGHAWHWTYEGDKGPAYWVSHHDKCDGQSQSPIDIPLSEVTYDPSHGHIRFHNYESSGATYMLRNNGHAIQVDILDGNHGISEGKLPGHYILGQFHFHWGTGNTVGSEHLINGQQYPLEMHMVHYDSKYNSIGDAKEETNGLAVIGVMFQVGNKRHPSMDIIISNLKKVKHAGQSTQVVTFPLIDLLPNTPEKYFRYSGSLTTPTCDESVVWTVFSSPIIISQDQMDAFRGKLYQGEVGATPHVLINNYRPAQALNGRKIYSSFKPVYPGSPSSASSIAASIMCTVLGIVLKCVV